MGQGALLFSFLVTSLGLVGVFCGGPGLINEEPAHSLAFETNDVNHPMNLLEASPLGKNLNEVVDLIIQFVQDSLKKSGRATIKIPDIQETFRKRIHFIKIKGQFKADNGWLKDLSSIHRTTDATLSHSGGNVTVSVGLGLNTLEAGYNHYQVKVEHISISGDINAKAASNSVFVKVNVEMLDKGKCNLTLQQLNISLGGLKVHVGGKGKPLDWLLSKIATSVARHMKDDAIRKAQEQLSEAAQKALDKYHC